MIHRQGFGDMLEQWPLEDGIGYKGTFTNPKLLRAIFSVALGSPKPPTAVAVASGRK